MKHVMLRAAPPACSLTATAMVMFASGCASDQRGETDAGATIAASLGFDKPIAPSRRRPRRRSAGRADAPGGMLTRADALRRAITCDPALQAALARVRIAMADADQARLLPNPVLDVIVRWGTGSPQIEVSLAQDLIEVLKIPRRSSAADNRLRQAAADAVVVALDTARDVEESYVKGQTFDALLPLLEQQRQALNQLVNVAQQRVDAGEAGRSDLTALEAQRVALEVTIARSALEDREARLKLARLVGQPSSAATWTLDAWVAPPIDARTESEWIAAALSRRPEVQSIAWHLASLGDERALASLAPWDGASVGADAQKEPDWEVGPSISTPIPIFDMGQARRDRIDAEQLEARHQLTLERRTIVEEVRAAYQSLASTQASAARVRDELIPLQRRRCDLAQAAHQAEETDATPCLLAEQDLTEALADGIELERLTSLAHIRLIRAAGGVADARLVAGAMKGTP
jgi:cobalt-zinc-cadmium efflux system outer membrane protein